MLLPRTDLRVSQSSPQPRISAESRDVYDTPYTLDDEYNASLVPTNLKL
jgi:hypothetical protein